MKTETPSLAAIRDHWLEAWPDALAAWSKYTQLRPPRLCLTDDEAVAENLTGSFAMIRLVDQAIVVSLPEARRCHVESFAVEILAHEIGHHVLAPATVTEQLRLLARMRRSLPTVENHAPLVANLYTDLLINDRLQRSAGLNLAAVFQRLSENHASSVFASSASPASNAPPTPGATSSVSDVPQASSLPPKLPPPKPTPPTPTTTGTGSGGTVWSFYVRIYELLWSLQRGSLGGGKLDDACEGDALLGARLVRSYARDWLRGGGRFAALLLPHLLEDKKSQKLLDAWFDTRGAAAGGEAGGLVEVDADELSGARHPAADLAPGESDDDKPLKSSKRSVNINAVAKTPHADPLRHPQSHGQAREPYEYGEILRAAGIAIDDHEASVRYYRERARPHLIPFPTLESPAAVDPMPEGLEPWDIGHPLDAADWFQSLLQSPRIIPGMTTVQRTWGVSPGPTPERIPLDLDLYVDSSGSMPNPQHHTSFLTLAGAIVSLSALRAGARVQATLWSGKNEVTITPGFVRDESAILRVLTGFYGGGTQFPIHVLRDTYRQRRRDARPAHILVISDDGVSTLFDRDEKGNSGWDVADASLAAARGGGTLVLNLPPDWSTRVTPQNPYSAIQRARDRHGWRVNAVSSWDDLVAFAHAFSRQKYGKKPPAPQPHLSHPRA